MNTNVSLESPYLRHFRGSFTSALRWHHLDALWANLRRQAGDDWYIYAIGEPPPEQTATREQLYRFIDEVDALLRREHAEEYCGIVYADDLGQPSMIKVYDPNNLGVSCGFSTNPPLPGWVLSRLMPCDLAAQRATPANRKRWWQRVLGG